MQRLVPIVARLPGSIWGDVREASERLVQGTLSTIAQAEGLLRKGDPRGQALARVAIDNAQAAVRQIEENARELADVNALGVIKGSLREYGRALGAIAKEAGAAVGAGAGGVISGLGPWAILLIVAALVIFVGARRRGLV